MAHYTWHGEIDQTEYTENKNTNRSIGDVFQTKQRPILLPAQSQPPCGGGRSAFRRCRVASTCGIIPPLEKKAKAYLKF